jgi:hypothetical protein
MSVFDGYVLFVVFCIMSANYMLCFEYHETLF